MKNARTAAAVLAIAVLAVACVLLYRHYVVHQIMDGGDMTNPFITQSAPPGNGEDSTN